MISIVIPLFNKEHYVSKTLSSVLAQTYIDFEVIVVNDGSTDSSLQVVETFEDDRIRIVSIVHAGVSVARNTGIKAATHPWIAFLDADDWWDASFLAELMQATLQFPKHKLFASGRTLVYQDRSERYEHEYLPMEGTTAPVNYFKVISKYLPLINASNTLIQAALLRENEGFNPTLKQHEDHELWIRLAIKEEVVVVNKPLSFYNKTAGGALSRKKYSAANFKTYLETIVSSMEAVRNEERIAIHTYFQRFALLTYIKNYKSYNNQELTGLTRLLEKHLSGKHRLLFELSRKLPWLNFYTLLKPFHKKNE